MVSGSEVAVKVKEWLSVALLIAFVSGVLLIALPSPASADFSLPPLDQTNAADNRQAILGEWTYDGYYSAIEFLPNGALRGLRQSEQAVGRYWFVDDTHLRIAGLEAIGLMPGVYEVAVSGKHMTVAALGLEETYIRIW